MSKKKQGVIGSVYFNDTDEFEMEMLKHARRYGNFSKYMKRLLQRDMEGGVTNVVPTPSPKEITVDHSYVSSVI